MPAHYNANSRVDFRPHLPEIRADGGLLVAGSFSVRCSFVDGCDYQVNSLGKLGNGFVHGLHGVTDGQIREAGRGDEGGQVPGDGADHGDVEFPDLEGRVPLEWGGHLLGSLDVDIRPELIHPEHSGVHAPREVGPALVELVVAHGSCGEFGSGHHFQGGVVVVGHGLERGTSDVVPAADECDVFVPLGCAGLLHGGKQGRGVRQPTVEVVVGEYRDGAGGCAADRFGHCPGLRHEMRSKSQTQGCQPSGEAFPEWNHEQLQVFCGRRCCRSLRGHLPART